MKWKIHGALLATTCSLGAALAGAPAAAQQVTPEQAIAYLDTDADGKCSQTEYLMFQHGKLTQFDADGDGHVSRQEFRASLQGQGKKTADRSFDAFNRSGGKGLDEKEFLSYHAYVFQNFVDGDRDGFMSAEEWSAVMKAVG